MERLDKTVAQNLNITRKEARSLIKGGLVSVDGKVEKAVDFKLDESSKLTVNGKEVNAEKHVYIMLNKPAGVISASDDKAEKTVIDLLPDTMKRKGLFPAGRLDKDSTGFVLITDDGEFAHSVLSPSRHVIKTYLVKLDKPFDESVKTDFEKGMTLGEEKLLPAEIEAVGGDCTCARVVISQGIYHQIKRMFKKHGINVTALKRIKIGNLSLDESLTEGEARYITDNELLMIK